MQLGWGEWGVGAECFSGSPLEPWRCCNLIQLRRTLFTPLARP